MKRWGSPFEKNLDWKAHLELITMTWTLVSKLPEANLM